MAKLVLRSGGTVLNSYFVEARRLAIGRGSQNDIAIDDPVVSREHAAIVTVGADQIVEDLGSTYGTFVNGRRIARQILQHRDVIEFGAFSLVYLNSKAAAETDFDRTMIIAALPRQPGEGASAAPSGAGAAPAARAVKVRFPGGRLRRLAGSRSPEFVPLDRVVVIVGRPGVQLAVITRRPHGFFLTHVEGRQRARLNGRPIDDEPQALRDRDVIEVADEQLEFQLDPVS